MKIFLGNLEDPTVRPIGNGKLVAYPAAFWLEPHWRNSGIFTVDWLLSEARKIDIVMLIHPENVLASPQLTADFVRVIAGVESKVIE